MVNKSIIQKFWKSTSSVPDEYYFIAEIGNNHNGSVDRARELIDVAVHAGAHCVKFQMRDMKTLYRNGDDLAGEDLGVEYTKDLLNKFNLSINQHKELKEYAEHKNVDYLCTPWDIKSIEILEDFGVPAYKVASADFTNLKLISILLKTQKPIMLSTGMTKQTELEEVLEFIEPNANLIALLHCNSTYPAPFSDIDLRQIQNFKKYVNIVGYSGHERGIAVTLGAYTLGARILERHITLDRTMEGPDHAASLEPSELVSLLTGLREIKMALGHGKKRHVSQGEMINRENLGKSLVASRNITTGEVIKPDDIQVMSPGRGLSPLRLKDLLGRTAIRDISKASFFEQIDLLDKLLTLKRNYKINSAWGIPVRYHDYPYFSNLMEAKMWEFHLSYKDLLQSPSLLDFKKSDAELVVHAPELFQNSHLLDLTSPDKSYREISIANMHTVIEQTKKLGVYFKVNHPIKIVVNVGGFSMDEPLPYNEQLKRYEILENSLTKLHNSDVELLPQTMAPFPWHFGGQRFQNIFLDPAEIVKWCKQLSLRICLDTSHSKLYCNYKLIDFKRFLEQLFPITAHIHLGDAEGINGEGLQLGEGDIDFVQFYDLLKRIGYDHSILPEIWQGHKNNGQGFRVALEKMEELSK